MNRRSIPPPTGITVQDDGMSTRELITLAVASSTLVISVAVAIAVWKIATGVMYALIILAIGSAGQMILVGAGIYQRHRLTGLALLEEAKGKAHAAKAEGEAALLSARIRRK